MARGELFKLLRPVQDQYGGRPPVFDLVPLHKFFKATPKDKLQSQLYEISSFDRVNLQVACRNGAPPEIIQQLVDADKSKKTLFHRDSRRGGIAIHYACFSENPRGGTGWFPLNLEVVKLLVEADPTADKRTLFDRQRRNNKTPAELAQQAVGKERWHDPTAPAIVKYLKTEMSKLQLRALFKSQEDPTSAVYLTIQSFLV